MPATLLREMREVGELAMPGVDRAMRRGRNRSVRGHNMGGSIAGWLNGINS